LKYQIIVSNGRISYVITHNTMIVIFVCNVASKVNLSPKMEHDTNKRDSILFLNM